LATKLAREVLIADCPPGEFNFDKVLTIVVKSLTRKFKDQECAPQGRVLYLNPPQRRTPPARSGPAAAKKTASAGRKTSTGAGKKR
jgi:hypothetical protein